MDLDESIKRFFESSSFAVVGVSSDRSKFGNRVFRKYQQHKRKVYPVNPGLAEVEGEPCLTSVRDLPEDTRSISIVTPPSVTERIVEEAIEKGIQNVWMQPGAESELAVRRCREGGLNVIAGGPCVLVELG